MAIRLSASPVIYCGFMAITLLASTLGAATFTWNVNSAGPNDWNSAANWTPATGFPNAIGDVANVTNDITVDQSIDLEQSITVGVLNIGDSAGGPRNNFAIQKGTGAGALTLNNGASDSQINNSAGVNSININVPITFNGNVNIDVAGGSTLNLFPQNAFGDYFGGTNVVKTGAGSLTMGRFGVLRYTGELRVKAGSAQGGRPPSGTGLTVYSGASYSLTDFSPNFSYMRGGGSVTGNNVGMVIGTGSPDQTAQKTVLTTGGEIRPGDTDAAANAVGTLTLNHFSGAGFRMESGSSLYIDIAGRSTGGTSDPNFDHFNSARVQNRMNGGTLYVRLLGTYQPTLFQTFVIMDANPVDAGYFEDGNGGNLFDSIIDFDNDADRGWVASLTNLQTNPAFTATFGKFTQIQLTYIPEPTALTLLALPLLVLRRRH